uniref:RNA polymerase beta'' subunit n=1 Tax=Microzonia abyssicola TaxID=217214 RepID=UPI002E76006F|nr:RNA polymerase beta'' subunit [Syringoderma abyssicola]WAM65001.1 RNA polymerase beta'' subunit [Syringoderma abyssicola]
MIKNSKIFSNNVINKKELKKIIEWAFKNYGHRKAAYFVDQLKELGFDYATKSGISISLEDLKVPPIKKSLMEKALGNVFSTEAEVKNGQITDVERFQKIINIWNVTSENLKERLIEFFKKTDPLNSVYIMAFSGARGNIGQVRQLVGMRGLMSDPNGQIIDKAISANFREGLSITDYIISSYGARKGLVDTAIKTADSGYLTRRLVEVVQSIIISELDCKTERGIILQHEGINKDEVLSSFKEKSIGRVLAAPILKPKTNEIIAIRNQQITSPLVEKLFDLKIGTIIIRSPLTCQCRRAVCQQCYGWNIASGTLVDLGETIGLIAAQSIGEPGTQLTMRTFHTGGVFTSALIRQACAESSGYIDFSPELDVTPFRTNYGQDALLSHSESSLSIINNANESINVRVKAQTLILVENNAWIKRGDVLFEAAPKTKEIKIAKKEIKYIVAQESGELILEDRGFPQKISKESFRRRPNRNYIFWILSGQVFRIPFSVLIRGRKLKKVYKNQSIAQAKIVTTIDGFVKYCKTGVNQEVNSIKVQNFSRSLKNFKIYIEKTNFEISKCKLYLSHTYDISLKPKMFNDQVFLIGALNNNNYRTKTGGKFYILDFPEPNVSDTNTNCKRQCGCTIFYLPEATIETDFKKKSFNFKSGTYVNKNLEIFPEYFINLDGFIHVKTEKQIKIITIKPGSRYFSKDKTVNFDQFTEQIYYPGELLLETFEVQVLSYLEIETSKKGTYIYLRPITRYEVTKENSFKDFNQSFFINTKLKIENHNLLITSGKHIKVDTPIQFISSPLTIDHTLTLKNTEIICEFKGPKKKNSWGQLRLGYVQTFLFETLIPKEIRRRDIALNLIVEEGQFVEAYSVLGAFEVILPWDDFIYDIKIKTNPLKSNLLLATKTDYKSMFFENFTHKYKQNSFIHVNNTFNNNLSIRESGILSKVLGNKFIYQLGQPYLFSKGAVIRKIPGDYIQKQEILGQLVYERLKTGDIVQGLPKIDEILEARKPKIESVISTRQGFITDIEYKSNLIYITTKPSSDLDHYFVPRSERLLVKKFEYVYVGQPLTEGPLNPHTLLHVYFKYFFSLGTLSMYESAYRSIKKIQTLLFNSVQAIYFSQGVIISNKHIELIIKEMTGKVYLEYPGETNFLPGDILDLEQANYINLSIQNNNKMSYRPILLGITKSSLKNDGFLAAASFQETTRVLTQAAIQGKTDWLRGLKENAITGRLIPAGTGFYADRDISFNKTLLPKPLIEEKDNLSLKNQLKLKQLKLKQVIKFKFKYNNK